MCVWVWVWVWVWLPARRVDHMTLTLRCLLLPRLKPHTQRVKKEFHHVTPRRVFLPRLLQEVAKARQVADPPAKQPERLRTHTSQVTKGSRVQHAREGERE